MQKTSISLLSIASAVALSSCTLGVSDSASVRESSAPSEVADRNLETQSGTVSSGAISTQTSSGIVMVKKEYAFPGGKATLEGAITVGADGVITWVQIFNPAGYIEKFAKGIQGATVGKKISGLQIDTVSGASLTTAAFNEVLAANTR